MWFDKGNRCFKYLIKNKLGASLRSRLRDLALSLQQPGSLLSLGLSGNFLMPGAWPKKKKRCYVSDLHTFLYIMLDQMILADGKNARKTMKKPSRRHRLKKVKVIDFSQHT